MNIATVRSILTGILNTHASAVGGESVGMSQGQLTSLTDDLAANGLETVNPNGPGYPSTPK